MKEFKFVPTVCQIKKLEDGSEVQPVMSGDITLEAPTFDQRFEYIEQAGFEMDDKGNIQPGFKQMAAIRRMAKLARPHYKAVNLKVLDDSTEFKSLEDLETDHRGDSILIEVAMQFMHGFKPSKN